MAVKPDRWIREMAAKYQMIEPFVDHQVRDGISYGLSSYGYDFRLAPEFKFPVVGRRSSVAGQSSDPKNAGEFVIEQSESVIIPPGSYCLGKTVEYFRIPRDVLTICYGKSTYARCGVAIHVTPFEPEWEGHATISITNCSGLPAKVYANEGIGQIIFLGADEVCEVSYADKRGKYQAQKEITTARVG